VSIKCREGVKIIITCSQWTDKNDMKNFCGTSPASRPILEGHWQLVYCSCSLCIFVVNGGKHLRNLSNVIGMGCRGEQPSSIDFQTVLNWFTN
jgi:hypothetical protein